MHRLIPLIALLTFGCTTVVPTAAPWRQPSLAATEVPDVYFTEWEKAENRATCTIIAPRSLGAGAGATPRAATFAGGWAVAYDLTDLRSAFGVAGAGVSAKDPAYDAWPYAWSWDDGKVQYGPEGGEGPNQLAYVRIKGQECLYNVWSRLGREHLEHLLRELRLVETNR